VNKKEDKGAKYWFEIAESENEEIEQKTQEFFRNAAQRPMGIPAERAKFTRGVKTGSYKRLPSDK